MKNYYCINLKFKDKKISEKIHHSHFYVSDSEMYLKIYFDDENSRIDRKYMLSKNTHGFFEDTFEIINTEIGLLFNKSRIYRTLSNDVETYDHFTIYVSDVGIIFPNVHREFINEGQAVIDDNGLKIVNGFYSFFTNIGNKNQYSISRMNGMKDFYKAAKMNYRPELNFVDNEKRGSSEFTVIKIPIINFNFNDIDFEDISLNLEDICYFISFCFGIRINIKKISYRTEEEILIYRKTLPNHKTYISEFLVVFDLLKENYNIQKILNTNWHKYYSNTRKKINKAIDNYLHSREVDLSASYLLLFNIIEIFNVKQDIEQFEFDSKKEEKFDEAFELISGSLINKEDEELLKNKWKWVKNKIAIKPMKSSLEETLKINNINSDRFGYSFSHLKKTRDKLTHGSVNSIPDKKLKSQIRCLRKISACLILANLGLKEDIANAQCPTTHPMKSNNLVSQK
ncbi:hypothetical protein [Salegentibacter maritimus]|uniref:hypothetical protein n=1 Tax=Salegentibacter maritimus TaxID=2794347 RepID=UPI0018E463B9|nr:hypothetical protein [Salegentibacter maritimus]MBI6118353.1 hypothetical protein [Salegentibacter maritimus]